MTNEEPIFRLRNTDGYCFLTTEDWTNNPSLNTFQVGVVTYQKDYPEFDGQARQYVSIHDTLAK